MINTLALSLSHTHTYTHTRTRAHTHSFTLTHTRAHMHTHTHSLIHTHSFTLTHTHTHTHTYTHILLMSVPGGILQGGHPLGFHVRRSIQLQHGLHHISVAVLSCQDQGGSNGTQSTGNCTHYALIYIAYVHTYIHTYVCIHTNACMEVFIGAGMYYY